MADQMYNRSLAGVKPGTGKGEVRTWTGPQAQYIFVSGGHRIDRVGLNIDVIQHTNSLWLKTPCASVYRVFCQFQGFHALISRAVLVKPMV